jgi:hypothetical protein
MKQLLVVALSAAMFCTACSTAWISTLDSILAAAAPALIDILQIVAASNGSLVSADEVSKIDIDVAAIKTLASDFASSSMLAAPGVCSQLRSAIAVYQQDQQFVFLTAQVSNAATQTKIALLSDLVAGTADAMLAVMPSCKGSASAGFKSAAPLSAPRNIQTFVASYNAILTAKTGDVAVDAITGKLRLRQHSNLLRAITFGKLQ